MSLACSMRISDATFYRE